ncbi:hypothetical protein Hypma_003979 [Hypsizygus marmoreus]|uniref:Uncharacterized protein n=1 Tax=Hypsizygus marmoreus TaxID=39966 RepID=A0A369J505_HYPMA|nr:hypothetical protein Hypma_003979 [Hypsizygus marmoreus]
MCYAPHETVLDCIRIGRGKNPGSSPTSSSRAEDGEVQRGSASPISRPQHLSNGLCTTRNRPGWHPHEVREKLWVIADIELNP